MSRSAPSQASPERGALPPCAALARASSATTPLAERRRPRLSDLLRLDVYVVPPLRCISYISPSRTQCGHLAPNLANQLRNASLHSDPQFTLRGIYRRVTTSSWDGIADVREMTMPPVPEDYRGAARVHAPLYSP
ncbi:hypothetical protein B0H19DRAFT_1274827 [Mycena capillaripes]|nr:hypothetical protein B0H19DRAFT_1274827 [Mycena capillaripes]